MDDHVPGDAWTDERLEAAFAALAPTGRTPPSLEARVLARLDARPSRRGLAVPGLALAGLVVVLVVAVAGPSLLGGLVGPPGGGFTVRDGEAGTKVLDAGEFSFAFPAAWTAVDSGVAFSGGSSIAVLGTLPVEPRCGTGHVDINCVYEQRLEPGTVRAWVGTAAFRGGTILDEPEIDGTWTDLTVDGFPARLEELRVSADDDDDRADLDLRLLVARPAGFGHVVEIELRARDPGADAARAAMDEIIASFRYAEPPPTLAADADGEALARQLLPELDEALRHSIGEGSGGTPYSCQPAEPGVVAEAELGYDFDSFMGGPYRARCSWSVARDGDRFWRLELYAEWDVDGGEDAGTETFWIDATGGLMGRRLELRSGDPGAAPATLAPVPGLPAVEEVLGLPVLTVEEALAVLASDPGDREIAVMGWWPGDPLLECPAPERPPSSPAETWCPDLFRHLTAQRESTITVRPDGFEGRPPTSPHLVLHYRDGAGPPVLPYPAEGPVDPIPLLVLGHVADHRAPLCLEDLRAACESTFIVDLVVIPGESAVPVRLDDLATGDGELVPTAHEDVTLALATMVTSDPETARVIAVLRLEPGALVRTEPAYGAPGITRPDGVTWVVKVLVGSGAAAHIETIALPDVAFADTNEAVERGFRFDRLTRGGIAGEHWSSFRAFHSPGA